MSDGVQTGVAPVIDAERPALLRLAYRMLGSVTDAEDVVQDAVVRWLRLGPAERSAIANPTAWLVRVTSRICLDVLGSARVRREAYVGPWLPEPLPAYDPVGSADPLAHAMRDDSVSMALLVVMDVLSPAERVAFVLHDVFDVPHAEIAETLGRSVAATRQLATAARRKVAAERAALAPRTDHDRAVRAFAAACASGDLRELVAALAPGVVLTSDGGGRVSAARRPVVGAENVARFLFGVLSKRPHAEVAPVKTADGDGFVIREDGAVTGVVVLRVRREVGTTDVWFVRNPEKLRRWR
jgi:RNA polymerase sigma-70 factor (ECF subfamily)